MKKIMLFFALMITSLMLFAQEPTPINLIELIGIGGTIFVAGLAGLPTMALIAQIKRWLNIYGIWVRLVSLLVSAGCVIVYLIPAGWNWWHFVILTIVVTLSANGIHLDKKRRIKTKLSNTTV